VAAAAVAVLKAAQSANYYAFRRFVVKTRGYSFTVVGKPGVWSWDGLDPGTAALLEVTEVKPSDAVLDLGCGTGVVGAVAALQASQGRVTLVDCNVAAAACAERTLAANDLSNARVQLADGVAGLSPASFDLVLSHLPRGRAVQEELVQGAAWVLRPGGRFVFVAHKRSGVKGAIAYARELFGRCGVVRQKKGYHVALAVKPDALEVSPPGDSYVTCTIALDGAETTLVSKPGVFAWDRLDDGAEALIGAMEIGAGGRVLDLGCGTGLAGLVAARRAPEGQVMLVDADARAVESARRTLAANKVTGGEVLLSDCASAVLGRQFDVVVANPPFHQGVGVDYEVACQFVRDAARVLRPGGRLFLVANRFLRYGNLISETFGNVETAYADDRYHVLTAVVWKSGSG
jgi:16S rRNA (guanine1207-N2)-methyltransferase